ncbi:cytochrome b (mitochondrion) [Fonticula alba]|uniref:Cytochrome b n=1 Tax=Fonticula alba TaxID=691883 RepID=A0A058YYU9_FONAL|nr:cytochrome b [Fonticula alba]KCV67185.1 cytochrome b [Fonticula alba]|eukprot:XP_009498408.1 cytochrome b (mitochondrion) [Fonticula alba]
MKLSKRLSGLSHLSSALVESSLPANISYFWNFGSILGICLVIQIASGVVLAMHYTPHVDLAFISVEHIMRDVNLGWLIRYSHANGASFFFMFVYVHIARGLYFGSYTKPRVFVWSIGVIIFLIMMGTAFLGYVLPWGQMSFWAATVITNMLSAIPWIGQDFVQFVWGGFSVDNATLNRFFSLHYLLPFLLAGLVIMHILALHKHGSNNPMGFESHMDKTRLHDLFTVKDIHGFILFFLLFSFFVFFYPNVMGHPDNYIPANPLVTPAHIVPEWYFLPFYAILRSIPSKLGGVIAMIGAILILLALPFLHTAWVRSATFRPIHKFLFWIFVGNFLILGYLGGAPMEAPYTIVGVYSTVFYFSYFLIINPLVGIFENVMILLFSFRKRIKC